MRFIRSRWWMRWRRRWSSGAATGNNEDLASRIERAEIHFLCHAAGMRGDGGVSAPVAESGAGSAAGAGAGGAGGYRGGGGESGEDGDAVCSQRSGRFTDVGG